MKQAIYFLAIFCFYNAIGQQKSDLFVIRGHALDKRIERVFLFYNDKNGKDIHDSVVLHNGDFTFTGHIGEPQLAYFWGKTDSSKGDDNYAQFFLEPGSTRIEVAGTDMKEASISGTAHQREWATYYRQRNKIFRRWEIVMDTLHEVNKRSNFQYQEFKAWVLSPRRQELDELRGGFIAAHPSSYVSAYLVQYNADIPADSLQKIYDRFSAALKKSGWGKHIAESLSQRRLGVPGLLAENFTAPDIDGRPLSLTDYKGKYVLLDFWASWCLPCRKQSPHLRELYAKYRGKGFEIVGIASDDRKPEAWRAAVAADSLPWRQVLSGLQEKKVGDKLSIDESKHISKGYNIMTLPTQVLIDPNGKIIARYSEDAEDHALLDGKLKTIFE